MQDHYLPYLQELMTQHRDILQQDELRFRNLLFDKLGAHAPGQDIRLLAQVLASGYVRQRSLEIGDESALSRRAQDYLLEAGYMPTDIEEALNLWRQALPLVKKAPELTPLPPVQPRRKTNKASAESDLLQMVILPKVHSGNFSEDSEQEIYAAARVKGISDDRTRALIAEHAPELARLSAERLLDDELEEELPNRKLLVILGVTALVLCVASFFIVTSVLKPNVQTRPSDDPSSLIFGSDLPESPEPSENPSEEPSPEVSATVSPSATPLPTPTPEPTLEPTPFPTATPIPTAVPTPVPTRTPMPTPVPTNAPTTAPTLPMDEMMTPPPESLDPTPIPLPTEGT